jgi:hypothetical protein
MVWLLAWVGKKHEREIKSFFNLFNIIMMEKWWHDINVGKSPIMK